VLGVGAIEDDGSLLAHESSSPVVHVGRGGEPDPGVTMLVVVPTEGPAAEGVGVLEAAEPVGELGPVLEGAELALAEGLSLLTCGRLWLFVTPRSASRRASGLAVRGDPRSARMVSWPCSTFRSATVSASRASARRAFSAWASIQPDTERRKMSTVTYRQ
jgi:hypothetical protein